MHKAHPWKHSFASPTCRLILCNLTHCGAANSFMQGTAQRGHADVVTGSMSSCQQWGAVLTDAVLPSAWLKITLAGCVCLSAKEPYCIQGAHAQEGDIVPCTIFAQLQGALFSKAWTTRLRLHARKAKRHRRAMSSAVLVGSLLAQSCTCGSLLS